MLRTGRKWRGGLKQWHNRQLTGLSWWYDVHMGIIEPGSLDLSQTTLRIGAVKLSENRQVLVEGNKFVVVEHHVDHQGNPIDEERFDHRRMCYSLFIAPEPTENGRHVRVLGHHSPISGKTGRIVGGGLLTVKENLIGLQGASIDFNAEPLQQRQQFGQLLLPELKKILGKDALRIVANTSFWSTNLYWLRFRQILEEMQKDESQKERLPDRLQWYRKQEKNFERQIPS